VKNKYK